MKGVFSETNNIKVWRERKPTRSNNQMFIINFCLNMFQASLCPSSGEQRPCVTAYGVLRWFCWMLVDSGCGALRCRVRAVLESIHKAQIQQLSYCAISKQFWTVSILQRTEVTDLQRAPACDKWAFRATRRKKETVAVLTFKWSVYLPDDSVSLSLCVYGRNAILDYVL